MTSKILIVDDQVNPEENSLGLALGSDAAEITIRHPRDVLSADLADCSAVLVDHYFENWPELDALPPAISPRDGFALAAVLRSQISVDAPGPAIAILTGQLEKLAGSLPVKTAEHLLAWQHDVEWVFSKSDARLVERMHELVDAVWSLGLARQHPHSIEQLAQWLDLKDVPWRGVALDHVVQTRPPIHTLQEETNGTSVLRWFLQRILPYPAFLADIHWTATRLDTTARWLQSELDSGGGISDQLATCEYSGAFATFSGRRWWRAGIADAVARLSEGQPFDREALRAGVRALSSQEPEFLVEAHPVLAVDPTTMQVSRVVEAENAVQIGPDGWPIYADSVWAALEDVQADPMLMEVVLDSSQLPLDSTS